MSEQEQAALLLKRVRSRLSGREIEVLETVVERGRSYRPMTGYESGTAKDGGGIFQKIILQFADQLKP